MEDLYECIRIMQISTEKLQSTKSYQSLHRSLLIRSTFLQSKKYFGDLICSFIKISSTNSSLTTTTTTTTNPYLPMFISTHQAFDKSSQKRKSSHVDTVKRLRITSA